MKEASSFFSQTYQARKIVVVDFGFLGDTVHLIPALWDLQSNYPEAELHVVTTEVGGEVLKMAPCVQKVWTYKLTNPSPPWYKSLGLVWQLRKEKFNTRAQAKSGQNENPAKMKGLRKDLARALTEKKIRSAAPANA